MNKKIIITVIMVLTSFTLSAQMSGSFEFGWAPEYRLGVMDNDMEFIRNGDDCSQIVTDGMFYTKITLDYSLSIFSVYGYLDTWMMKIDSIYFAPLYADYQIGFEVEPVKNLFIYAEHNCIHPVFSGVYDGRYLRGGSNKIGVRVDF